MSFEGLLGGELLKQKETIKTSTLEGKYLMLYFSAHWCGPCRMFTPSLIKFYNEMKSKRDDFELVFVSSDRDQHAFDEYYGEMPWLALPYSERDRKGAISGQFKVRGIPTLVVLGKDGTLITDGARSNVTEDPEGADFPWIPPTLDQILGNEFINNKGEKVEKQLKGKIFGLYFSAHWCPPCKMFTPILIEKFKELTAQGKDFEIVFVSSDRDQHSFDEYFGEMPWLAVPFTDKKRSGQLSNHFEVEGIPSLVIIDTDLSTITSEGVEAVSGGGEFPFRPLPLNELGPATASSLNTTPSMILFCDAGEAETYAEMIRPMAEEYTAAKKGLLFYYTKSHPIVARVRDFTNVPAEGNALILLDIPSQKKAVATEKTFTAESVRAFVDAYLGKKLTMVGIKE